MTTKMTKELVILRKRVSVAEAVWLIAEIAHHMLLGDKNARRGASSEFAMKKTMVSKRSWDDSNDCCRR